MAGNDSEESKAGILQAIIKLLSQESSRDNAQASQDSSVTKKNGEDSQQAKPRYITQILSQENYEEQENNPVPDSNMTEDDLLRTESKIKSSSPEANHGNGPRTASHFEPPTHYEPHVPTGHFPSSHHKFDLFPSADSSQWKESDDMSRISADIICGPYPPCVKTTTKILGRIAELESKRKSLFADYEDTVAADRGLGHGHRRAH